jgi:hypothetical protein
VSCVTSGWVAEGPERSVTGVLPVHARSHVLGNLLVEMKLNLVI